jgi:hypothetical protein
VELDRPDAPYSAVRDLHAQKRGDHSDVVAEGLNVIHVPGEYGEKGETEHNQRAHKDHGIAERVQRYDESNRTLPPKSCEKQAQ